jgi:hypothetical protein
MVEVNTDAWLDERIGKFTGSGFGKLMAYPDRPTLAAGAKSYVLDTVAEELCSNDDRFEGNEATEWGHTYEPKAITEYEILTGKTVSPSRWVVMSDHIGCTPDGFFGDDGIVEIKCPPKKSNHLKYLMVQSGADLLKAEKNYYWQCQGNMMVTGAKYCIFITYHPHYRGALSLGHAKIERNEKAISQLRVKLAAAILMKRSIYRKLKIK